AVLRQFAGEDFQWLDPLREDDGFAAAVGDFGEVGLKLLQLGADAGGGGEVANLLEAQNQLEGGLHGDGVAQGIEAGDYFFFGDLVRVALGRRQLQKGVANGLGRQVGQHVVLGATED